MTAFEGEQLTVHEAMAKATGPGETLVFPGDGVTLTGDQLWNEARDTARGLVEAGVRPGDIVGLLAAQGPRLWTALFGVTAAGAAVSALPSPPFGHRPEELAGRLVNFVDSARMRHVVVDGAHAEAGRELRRLRPGLTLIDAGVRGTARLPECSPDALAFVQYTSGSTAQPKGVMLSHRTVLAGLDAIVRSADFTPADKMVCWVPPFHDLGLFSPMASLLSGGAAHLFPARSFIRDPAGVVSHLGRSAATVMPCPNFGYEMILKEVERSGCADCGTWRLAFNGAEPVSDRTVDRFAEVMGRYGVGPEVMYPVYGMAEAVLAVAFPPPGTRPRFLHVDRGALADQHLATAVDPGDDAAKTLVSVGRPVHGMRLRIADGDDRALPEGRVGEIQIQGSAVTGGYLHAEDATAAAFAPAEWFRTGDLGFRRDGELYIAGRIKEMVVIAGRNFFCEDLEGAARGVPDVIRCVAVGTEAAPGADGERVALLVETRLKPDQRDALASRIRHQVGTALDLDGVDVHFTRPGSLPRTTSGKYQRGRARDLLADARIPAPRPQ